MNASFHCAAFSRRTSPDSSAAMKTPVPAAESQLIVKRAASAFALGAATGGIRCTMLCSDGISHTGRDKVPPKVEPNSVVLNVTPEKSVFMYFLKSGQPHSAQHRMRMTHGNHAWAVSLTLYLYFHSDASAVTVAALLPAFASASRSDLSKNRVFGCQTKRRNNAVQMTEKTPETTSVIRWKALVPDAKNCISANDAPAHSAAGQTSNTSFHVPPSIFTKVATNQNGTMIETKGNWRPAIAESVN